LVCNLTRDNRLILGVYVCLIGFVMMDRVIGGKFKLGRKIGSGSFGELYLGM